MIRFEGRFNPRYVIPEKTYGSSDSGHRVAVWRGTSQRRKFILQKIACNGPPITTKLFPVKAQKSSRCMKRELSSGMLSLPPLEN